MSTFTPALGIDFGTSKSSMSWYNPDTGRAELIRNAEGEDKTPSIVYFGERQILVGKSAEDMLEDEQERRRVILSVKRDMVNQATLSLMGRKVSAVQAAAEIFRKLKRDAEEGHFHQQVNRAVITCPAAFDSLQREKIEEAAKLAGFAEVKLLVEPVAAALAYTRGALKVGNHVLVYDLGAGTFDVAVLTRDDSLFRVALPPKGIARNAGDDFDNALYDHCDEVAQQTLNRPISLTGQRDLLFLRQCRLRKENLSRHDTSTFSSLLPSPNGVIQFKHTIDRATFDRLIEPYVRPTVRLTQQVLEEARSKGLEVDTVLLIGGSSRVPLVRRLLQEALAVAPQTWTEMDTAVALGAAYSAQAVWEPKQAAVVTPSSRVDHNTAISKGQGQDTEAQRRVAAGQTFLQQGNVDASVAELEKAYQLAPVIAAGPYARALYMRGTHKQQARDLAGALNDYQQAKRLVPGGQFGGELDGAIVAVQAAMTRNGRSWRGSAWMVVSAIFLVGFLAFLLGPAIADAIPSDGTGVGTGGPSDSPSLPPSSSTPTPSGTIAIAERGSSDAPGSPPPTPTSTPTPADEPVPPTDTPTLPPTDTPTPTPTETPTLPPTSTPTPTSVPDPGASSNECAVSGGVLFLNGYTLALPEGTTCELDVEDNIVLNRAGVWADIRVWQVPDDTMDNLLLSTMEQAIGRDRVQNMEHFGDPVYNTDLPIGGTLAVQRYRLLALSQAGEETTYYGNFYLHATADLQAITMDIYTVAEPQDAEGWTAADNFSDALLRSLNAN